MEQLFQSEAVGKKQEVFSEFYTQKSACYVFKKLVAV
jgi:hypothetical protein